MLLSCEHILMDCEHVTNKNSATAEMATHSPTIQIFAAKSRCHTLKHFDSIAFENTP